MTFDQLQDAMLELRNRVDSPLEYTEKGKALIRRFARDPETTLEDLKKLTALTTALGKNRLM